MKLQEIVLKRNSMRFAAALLGNWPALLPVRMQLWLPRPSIMIRRRASTDWVHWLWQGLLHHRCIRGGWRRDDREV